jgi:NAD(P)-dependent dehydrogenase (short-subunit alcohol dehydrogenase family)
VIGRNTQRLHRIAKNSPNVFRYVCDVSDHEAVIRLARTLHGKFGKIHHIAICAGIFEQESSGTIDKNVWVKTMASNLDGAMFTLRELTPLLKKRASSSIVAIASILAHRSAANATAYCCSKAALTALVRSQAIELAGHRIRVNSISPAHIITPMIAPLLAPDSSYKVTKALYPLRRLGSTHDVSALALFLLSPFASWITGVDIIMDGGRSARV